MSAEEIDLRELDEEDEDDELDLDVGIADETSEASTEEDEDIDNLYNDIVDFCGGPDLIEVFGGSGSGKSVFSLNVVNSLTSNSDKEALFIDTERNIGNLSELEGADYIYIPDWKDVYYYIVGVESKLSEDPFGKNTTNSRVLEDGYDIVVLDSIGFPALIAYGEYRVEDDREQFQIFNEIQVITGNLKKYAQHNSSLVVVTNQPKSELSDEDDPGPFGDKAIFGFKEVWKTEKTTTRSTKTVCTIKAFRSRQVGKGRKLYSVEIDDDGVDITNAEEDSGEDWVPD